ncbi:MAG: ATP-binding protein [Anaerolineae bacterium]
MSLRNRFLGFSIAIIVIALVILYAASQMILLSGYESLEAHEITDDLIRSTNALNDRIRDLKTIAIGYAEWDDTRNYLLSRDPKYIDNNMFAGVYSDTGIDIAIFLNTDKEIVFNKGYDRQTGEEIPVPDALVKYLKPDSILLNHQDTQSAITGIVSLDLGSMIVVSLPVSNNQGTGPINGYMVWGRYVDRELIDQIAASTYFNITMVPYHATNADADILKARDLLGEAEPYFIQPYDEHNVAGYTFVKDIYGQPALLVRLEQSRALYQQGKSSLNYFLSTLLVIAVVGSAMAIYIVNRVILKRVSSLSQAVSTVRATRDLNTPITVTGTDELGVLAEGLREVLDTLAESRRHLMESNVQLEQRVAERTVELTRANSQLVQAQLQSEQARDEALEALRVRSQIIANISHDSRTPLTAIGLNIDILKRGHFGELNEKQQQVLERIIASNKRLMSLITNLLSEAQLNSDKVEMQLTPIALHELTSDLEKLFMPMAEQKGIDLTVEAEPMMPDVLLGDMERLKQILSNLVDNAIKFTDKGSVCVCIKRPDPEHWVVQITDTGRGIPVEAQSRVFEAFWQVDGSVTRNVNRGVGLGLSIVKRLVTAMAGEIQVESTLGIGTIFTVILPLQESSREQHFETMHSDH